MAHSTNFKHDGIRARFFAKVAKSDECWSWTGARRGAKSYGVLRIDGKLVNVHRLSWAIHHGEVPAGMCVCHRCNNKVCVNPSHLYLASAQQNVRDAWRDGLCERGEQKASAKLNREAVTEIRSSGATLASLAEKFGVSIQAVWLAKHGRRWAA